MHKCINNSIGNVYHLEQFVSDFFPYSQGQLGFDKPVTIRFESDKNNATTMLGKTAFYDPHNLEIVLYVDNRHPKDVMRSLSHELVHHAQNCRGDFGAQADTSPGYAQADPHLRKMEREAYTKGNLIFRDFEDLIKTGKIKVHIDFKKSGEPKMSLQEWKNKELNMLLMKKWGLLEEGKGWGKDPAAFTGDEKDEKEEVADIKGEKGLEEEAGHPGQSCEEAHPGDSHPMEEGWGWRDEDKEDKEEMEEASRHAPGGAEERHFGDDADTYIGPALGHGMAGNKKVGDPPAPGKRVRDPRHLSRTTTKVPAVKVREGSSRKISVREAREITQRVIQKIRERNK